jgi:hypothetical protein
MFFSGLRKIVPFHRAKIRWVMITFVVLLLSFLCGKYFWVTYNHLNRQQEVANNDVLFMLLFDDRSRFGPDR